MANHGDASLLTGLDGVRQPVEKVLVVQVVPTTEVLDVVQDDIKVLGVHLERSVVLVEHNFLFSLETHKGVEDVLVIVGDRHRGVEHLAAVLPVLQRPRPGVVQVSLLAVFAVEDTLAKTQLHFSRFSANKLQSSVGLLHLLLHQRCAGYIQIRDLTIHKLDNLVRVCDDTEVLVDVLDQPRDNSIMVLQLRNCLVKPCVVLDIKLGLSHRQSDITWVTNTSVFRRHASQVYSTIPFNLYFLLQIFWESQERRTEGIGFSIKNGVEKLLNLVFDVCIRHLSFKFVHVYLPESR